MKNINKRLAFILLTIVGLAGKVSAQSNDAKLTKVSITFSTHNDDKDDDTQLSVTIRSKVNLFLSKDIATGSNIGGNSTFDDPSTRSFDLTLSSANIKIADLTAPFVSIDIQPNGNDRWIFDFVVTLTFDDGNSFSSKSQGVILDQDNRHYDGVFSN